MNRLIMGMILILGAIYFIGGYYSIASQEANNSTPLTASTGHSPENRTTDFRHFIDQDVYMAVEGDQKFYLQFEPENTGGSGSVTFVMPNECDFVYGYRLEKDKIEMTYIGNTCGAEGKDAVMFIKENGSIATKIHEKEFVFNKD